MFISCRWSSEVSAWRWISSRTPTSWIDSTFSLCNSFWYLSNHLASLTLCMHLQKIADMKRLFREHEEQLERVKKSSKMVKESNIPKCQMFFTVFPTFRALCICMQDSLSWWFSWWRITAKPAAELFRRSRRARGKLTAAAVVVIIKPFFQLPVVTLDEAG